MAQPAHPEPVATHAPPAAPAAPAPLANKKGGGATIAGVAIGLVAVGVATAAALLRGKKGGKSPAKKSSSPAAKSAAASARSATR
jgi:poly-gamma-glutamate capsule biosynthesis protein CapA/YwtB (metallophosphatase superfamily)